MINLGQVLLWIAEHRVDIESDVRELSILAETLRAVFARPSVASATQASFAAAQAAVDAYEQVKLTRKETP